MARRYHFLDVGCADCTILELDNDIIVIDCGWSGKNGGQKLVNYIENTIGKKWIDLLIITHPHYDHFQGMFDLIDSDISITKFYGSPYERRYGDPSLDYEEYQNYIKAKEALKEKGAAIYICWAWDSLSFDNSKLMILNPPKTLNNEDTRHVHDGSVVVRLEDGADKLLICGDISDKALQWILDDKFYIGGTTILRCSHHGSLEGAHLQFIQATGNNKKTIVSTKSGVIENVPHPTALQRYSTYSTAVSRTDLKGDIIFS